MSGEHVISQFHFIRGTEIIGHNEAYIIDVWLRSQEDPYVREKITSYCSQQTMTLRHITAEYLDRVAKLKLFL
jgi:hypothetical protein